MRRKIIFKIRVLCITGPWLLEGINRPVGQYVRQATFSEGHLARNPLTLEDVGWLNGLLYRLTIRCKDSSRLIGYCLLADDFRLLSIIDHRPITSY